MKHETNPFQELYVTDSPNLNAYVGLFSDFPVGHAHALFQAGNVVLAGTQGSGKSMLLNLLKPEIRLAYHKAKSRFPVPKHLDRYIGAGLNLTKSGVLDIGQFPFTNDEARDEALFPLYFADLLNYSIVRDLFDSLELIAANPDAFENLVNYDAFDRFAANLAHQDCWFGSLSKCSSFDEVKESLDKRISAYRAFHIRNIRSFPPEIELTKTTIGEPIARTEECLKTTEVIPDDVPVFVRIDQVERLFRSDVLRKKLGLQYRRMINKALSMRDSRISYRIGVRTNAWKDDVTIFGTDDQLERLRDYRIINLDDILRRREDTKDWIFPEFAKDAFVRRLAHAGYDTETTKDIMDRGDPIRQVFGASELPINLARNYSGKSDVTRVLKLDKTWPRQWRSFLEDVFASDPLTAILASAWAKQHGGPKKVEDRRTKAPPIDEKPWDKAYWKKERIRQALLHLAVRSSQRLKWSGKEQIIALSAGNISIFLSICHEIWDVLLRSSRRKPHENRPDVLKDGIDRNIQTVGIQAASSYWHDKISEQAKGDIRQRFIDYIGPMFKSFLVDDTAMSFPGHTGFSLTNDDLGSFPQLAKYLEDAVGYGDLFEVVHTTKHKRGKNRTKWYLNPILSPHFQIPETHVKEPYYTTIKEVLKWLRKSAVTPEELKEYYWTSETVFHARRKVGKPSDLASLSLFPEKKNPS